MLFRLTRIRSRDFDRTLADAGLTNRPRSISHRDMPVKRILPFSHQRLIMAIDAEAVSSSEQTLMALPQATAF